MDDYSGEINQHYGQENLGERIAKALMAGGKDLEALTLEDLSTFDQLHAGGIEGTRALAAMAGIQAGDEVLDVGCGVGGPARTLAREFGCRVVGMDITQEYVDAAELLTSWVGLSEQVSFRQGDATALAFDAGSFDVVWSQNAFMNIENKAAVVGEVYRFLRPEGFFALETLLAGPEEGLQYPVFWAARPEISFLEAPEAFRQLFLDAGFKELAWRDVSQDSIGEGRDRIERLQNEGPGLGTEVLMDDVPTKGQNTNRGFEHNQLVDVYAVFQRSS